MAIAPLTKGIVSASRHFGQLHSSFIYRDALEHASRSAQVAAVMGSSIRGTGFVLGYLNSRGADGSGFLVTPILGRNGVGLLKADVYRSAGAWHYSSLSVTLPYSGQAIDLLVAPAYHTADLQPQGRLYLVTFGTPADLSLKDLAKYSQQKLGVTLTLLPSLPLDESVIDVHRDQAVTEEILETMKRKIPAAADPHAIVIAVTDRDMYARNWSYAFNYWQDNVAVISTARLDPKFYGYPSSAKVRDLRLRKLLARDIGRLYFHLPESADPSSVLYWDYSGIDDVDNMRESFRGLESRGTVTLYPTTAPVPPLPPLVRKQVAAVQPASSQYPCLVMQPKSGPDERLRGEDSICAPHLTDIAPVERYEVDLRSGWFVLRQTDLFLPDTVPLALTRTYSSWDTGFRSFGVGTNHPYDIGPYGRRNPYTYLNLMLTDGSIIDYPRISEGTGYRDALYEHASTSGTFYGSRIRWNGDGWDLTFLDGSVDRFPEAYWARNTQQGALVGMRDAHGDELRFERDGSRRLLRLSSPHGREISFAYDEGDRIVSASDNAGQRMEYSYDDGSRLRQVLRNGKLFRKYSYDYNRLLSIEDGNGHELLANQYYDNYRLKQLSLTDGSTWRFDYVYDKKYNVTATIMIDPAGHHRRIPVAVTRQEKKEE
ncbi:MAG TPA: cytochrome c oxidase assembly factor Coa1 family protein [Terriglobales bacterium]|nr:cytochrome c oxidase assembly factor Coa1 family protein [Terriglobales bacterium]